MRYSITFRSIDANNTNSTVVLGDSNTKYHYFEGDSVSNPDNKKPTFGPKMPGRRVPTFHTRQIDPLKCLGFRNIIVHVGVNDFNPKSIGRIVSDPDVGDVDSIFNNFVEKVESIRTLCPYARLIVSPILPTKLKMYNDRALQFNKLLFGYLDSQPTIKRPGFNSFANNLGFLKNSLGSFLNPNDPVHLGRTGIIKLADMFKECILGRQVDGRGYSSVVMNRMYAEDFPVLLR